jgi:hypothetical protein
MEYDFIFQDALIPDSDYALVDDALPQGKIHRIKSTSRKNEKGKPSDRSNFNNCKIIYLLF